MLKTEPPKTTRAPSDDAIAANTRGAGPKTSEPRGSSAGSIGPTSGVDKTTPVAKARSNKVPAAMRSPSFVPVKR